MDQSLKLTASKACVGKRIYCTLDSFRKRVIVVVVVVVLCELFFLVTSVMCVWIRGHGSKVTTIFDHFSSDFRLQLRSYQSVFVVLFLSLIHI